MRIIPLFACRAVCLSLAIALSHDASAANGPYSQALSNPSNPFDAPVPGFVGLDGEGHARLDDGQGGFTNARNYVNPLFFGWASSFSNYLRSDGQSSFSDPTLALGPVTGDNFDVVSLGDLSASQIASGSPPGSITLQFSSAGQPAPIRNLPGADFVVFENAFLAQFNTSGAGIGGILADLAYVEVSSDGVNFARFPSISLTGSAVGPYGSINPTNVFNLAGKHVNAYGDCWGTPFDLTYLAADPLVVNGTVNLNNIQYLRIVDIPGNGSFLDSVGHPIYDAWLTIGSGGFDLEAVGVVSVAMNFEQWEDLNGLTGDQRGPNADPDNDGVPNLVEYAFAMLPLTPDVQMLPTAVRVGSDMAIKFRRDVRAMDLITDVLGTSDLTQPWQTIARSTHGSNFVAVSPFAPVIDDASDSSNQSVGVVRSETVHAPSSIRFLKVSVSLSP